jgi:hypothetical protein
MSNAVSCPDKSNLRLFQLMLTSAALRIQAPLGARASCPQEENSPQRHGDHGEKRKRKWQANNPVNRDSRYHKQECFTLCSPCLCGEFFPQGERK